MKTSTLTLPGLVIIAAAATTGCVSVRKVAIDDSPRKNVRFESVETMQLFYDAILVQRFPLERKPSRVQVGQTLYSSERRPSANVVFNEAAEVADINHDGVISAQEVHTYVSKTVN
jgi:hypothetical protein